MPTCQKHFFFCVMVIHQFRKWSFCAPDRFLYFSYLRFSSQYLHETIKYLLIVSHAGLYVILKRTTDRQKNESHILKTNFRGFPINTPFLDVTPMLHFVTICFRAVETLLEFYRVWKGVDRVWKGCGIPCLISPNISGVISF